MSHYAEEIISGVRELKEIICTGGQTLERKYKLSKKGIKYVPNKKLDLTRTIQDDSILSFTVNVCKSTHEPSAYKGL